MSQCVEACVCIRNYAQDGIQRRIINANEVESGKFRFDEAPAAKVRSGMLLCKGEKKKREEGGIERERNLYRKYLRGQARAHNARPRDKEIIRGQVATGMLRRRYRSGQTVAAEKYPFALLLPVSSVS